MGVRECVVVHAGYTEELKDIEASFSGKEEFYLYAREESLKMGGKRHGMVIAGHTPTVSKGTFAYNKGKVFRYYDRDADCVFYDIDCGCVHKRGMILSCWLARVMIIQSGWKNILGRKILKIPAMEYKYYTGSGSLMFEGFEI